MLKGALLFVSSELAAVHAKGRHKSLRSTPVMVSVLEVSAWSQPITEQRVGHMSETAGKQTPYGSKE